MNRIRRNTVRSAIALCAVMAGIVTTPTVASAQVAAGDQYTPNPPSGGEEPTGGGGGGGGQGPGGGGGGNGEGAENPAGGGGDLSPAAGSAESDAGSLPFTGYPLTGVLLIALLLLMVGLVLRFARAGARLRSAPDTSS